MSAGSGSFRKKKNGVWEYRVFVGKDEQGVPVRRSFYAKAKSEAVEKYKDYLRKNQLVCPSAVTVRDWAQEWLEVYKYNQVGYTTYKNYKLYAEKYILPALGSYKIAAVKPAQVEALLSGAPISSLSASSQRHIYLTVKGIFDTAVENGACSSSPVKKRKGRKEEHIKPRVFPQRDLEKAIKAAKTDENGTVFLLLLYSGMRIGELAALKWTDIDGDTIFVQRSVAKAENGYIEKHPKSGKPRQIFVTQDFLDVLSRIPKSGEYVLSHSGKRYIPESLERKYRAFFRENNLPYLSPHKCRHTYATYLIQNGVNIVYVQSLLGHSSVRTTEIYTHVNTEPLREAAKKLKFLE